jgi:hypothetical protein
MVKEMGALLKGPRVYTTTSSGWQTETKGEPVMAKAELLPKDILVDLEQGDRTELFLGVAESDRSEDSLNAAFRQANQLGAAFANSSGSSFASAMSLQQILGVQQQLNQQQLNQQLGNQPVVRMSIDPAIDSVSGFIRGR